MDRGTQASSVRALMARTELALEEYLRLIEARRRIGHRAAEAAKVWNAQVFGRRSDHVETPATTLETKRQELPRDERKPKKKRPR